MRLPITIVALLAALVTGTARASTQSPGESRVSANDNAKPAGTLANGVLTVRLVEGQAQWGPEGSDGPALEVAAFGEEGGPTRVCWCSERRRRARDSCGSIGREPKLADWATRRSTASRESRRTACASL
jgi:hypothetical protein